MSYYEALPIYRAAMDATVLIDHAVHGFSRFHKYGVGARLRHASMEVVLLVARANRRSQRLETPPVLCDQVEELKLVVNIAKEVNAFTSFKQFAQVMEKVVAIARQAEGWRANIQSKGASGVGTPTSLKNRPEPERRLPSGEDS